MSNEKVVKVGEVYTHRDAPYLRYYVTGQNTDIYHLQCLFGGGTLEVPSEIALKYLTLVPTPPAKETYDFPYGLIHNFTPHHKSDAIPVTTRWNYLQRLEARERELVAESTKDHVIRRKVETPEFCQYYCGSPKHNNFSFTVSSYDSMVLVHGDIGDMWFNFRVKNPLEWVKDQLDYVEHLSERVVSGRRSVQQWNPVLSRLFAVESASNVLSERIFPEVGEPDLGFIRKVFVHAKSLVSSTLDDTESFFYSHLASLSSEPNVLGIELVDLPTIRSYTHDFLRAVEALRCLIRLR